MEHVDPFDLLASIMRTDVRTGSTASSSGERISADSLLRSLTALEATLREMNRPGMPEQMATSIFDMRMPSRIAGFDIVESKEVPRYQLPEELMPGVPWPPGFRDSINAWSREFLGTTNLVPRGHAFVIGGSHVVMRSDDVVKISNLGA